MKSQTIIFLSAAVLAMSSCGQKKETTTETTAMPLSSETPDQHTSQNSLDWNGTYSGVLPCADCEGIKTRITLKKDGSFMKFEEYLGRDGRHASSGDFEWNTEGNTITTVDLEARSQQYFVGENVLYHLDQQGNRITGDLEDMYMLKKNYADPLLENRKWILTELRGQQVSALKNQAEAFLQFDQETARMTGNNSCNVVSGSYLLKEGNRIETGQMMSTMMACPDMSIADEFNKILEQVDNYSVNDSTLTLNKARMAPLARFKLISE